MSGTPLDLSLASPLGRQTIVALAIAFGVAFVALIATRVLFAMLARWTSSRGWLWRSLVRRSDRPATYAFPLLAVLAVVPALDLPAAARGGIEHGAGLVATATIVAAIIALIGFWADATVARYHSDAEDNLRARQVGTRVFILSRALIAIVAVLGVATIAITFPPIRSLGTTLLASAGVAGIVAGVSARPAFENLIAGLQIAFTQPIRLDDVVIVEGEYGNIEEIGSTYVVVKLWDLRRMILPLTYFINTPFQNWTRSSSKLMGSVLIYVDYSVPVEELRAEHERIVKSSPLFDGAVQNLQVVDATERTMQLRALVSARNASELFDLRCYVRERLIGYLQERYPRSLPRARFENDSPHNGAVHAPGNA